MNNNIIGIIVGIILTLVVGLYAGISTSEGMETPLAIIGGIIAIIVLTALKDKVWILLFIAPFVSMQIPGLAKFHFFELMIGAVLPFYIFNIFLGRIRLTWVPNKWFDFWVFAFMILTVALMIRYPVGFLIDEESDYVNSRAYFDIIMAFVFYILLSTVNTKYSILKICCYAAIAFSFFSILFNLGMGILRPHSTALMSQIGNSRFGLFLELGVFISVFCIARYSLWDYIKKPWFILVALTGLAAIALSGFRNSLGFIVFIFLIVSLATRRYIDFILTPILGLVIIFLISLTFGLKNMPLGIQRTLSVLPFVEVKSDIRQQAEGSTQWRIDMWKYATDEKQSYIANKVWGDGFALKKDLFSRMNNEIIVDTREQFAVRGLWHSGPISSIHRYGYVGLAVASMIILAVAYYGFILCRIYYREPWGWTVVMLMGQVAAEPWRWYLMIGDIANFYQYIIVLPVIKLLMKAAKQEGLYIPPSIRKQYIPAMIKQDMTQKADTARKIYG